MDNIEINAQKYASMMLDSDNIFFNYLRKQLEKAYIAGAKEALRLHNGSHSGTAPQYY